MTGASGLGKRRSLEDRLRAVAQSSGRDLGWLRRRHVFIRALHRLAADPDGRWVLKGGVAVELRRGDAARATKDIDVAISEPADWDAGGDAARAALAKALAHDADGDLFDFVITRRTPLADDAYGRPAWRFSVDANLAGKLFVSIRIDLVDRPEELVGLTTLELPAGISPLPGAPIRWITVTDLRQQFAEKFHALTRSYSGGDSTRVKDLLDVVLLIDDGLRGDALLATVVRRVFTVRGTPIVPSALGRPPTGWGPTFAALAAEVGLTEVTAANAGEMVD